MRVRDAMSARPLKGSMMLRQNAGEREREREGVWENYAQPLIGIVNLNKLIINVLPWE